MRGCKRNYSLSQMWAWAICCSKTKSDTWMSYGPHCGPVRSQSSKERRVTPSGLCTKPATVCRLRCLKWWWTRRAYQYWIDMMGQWPIWCTAFTAILLSLSTEPVLFYSLWKGNPLSPPMAAICMIHSTITEFIRQAHKAHETPRQGHGKGWRCEHRAGNMPPAAGQCGCCSSRTGSRAWRRKTRRGRWICSGMHTPQPLVVIPSQSITLLFKVTELVPLTPSTWKQVFQRFQAEIGAFLCQFNHVCWLGQLAFSWGPAAWHVRAVPSLPDGRFCVTRVYQRSFNKGLVWGSQCIDVLEGMSRANPLFIRSKANASGLLTGLPSAVQTTGQLPLVRLKVAKLCLHGEKGPFMFINISCCTSSMRRLHVSRCWRCQRRGFQ